jgi:DNA-binding transcriptional ArsR family regulator
MDLLRRNCAYEQFGRTRSIPAVFAAAWAYISSMSGTQPSLAEVAALIGNPARANILTALMDGRARTAGELTYAAGVSPQTASGHLAQLSTAKLIVPVKQGRHRYFRLAAPKVARMLEGIMVVAGEGPERYRPRWKGDDQLRTARTCYDHLAGRLGVALADALVKRKHVTLLQDGGTVTRAGVRFLADFGVSIDEVSERRRAFCKPCMDWSERRPHIAGALGAALADRCLDLGWVTRDRDSRALKISPKGEHGFADAFGIKLGELNECF